MFKLVLVGDCGVGKTQIRSRYTMDEFNSDSKSTIGVEFAFKTIDIKGDEIKGKLRQLGTNSTVTVLLLL